jgi:hypothetical protein
MKKVGAISALLILLIGATGIPGGAGTWGIGFGNPYVSLKYLSTPTSAFELRAAFGSGISAYSLRLYSNSKSRGKTITFVGLEGGMISFKEEDSPGSGSFGMLFIGFEHSIRKNMTFSFDIGPAYITLASGTRSAKGVEWVYNLAVNLYFK